MRFSPERANHRALRCQWLGQKARDAVKNKLVVVPSVDGPIKESHGFAKKRLSTFKLDILGLCGFGCRYCSSNTGNYLRINRKRFANLTEEQLGERVYPIDDPALTFVWRDVLAKLEAQLRRKPRSWGQGETLVFSMLTDGFSPSLVADGTTRRALELVLERTSFRIRVLTKNAIVGTREWIEFFLQHRERFVVGLSTGTMDDDWSRQIEIGTSLPSARLRALRALQDAGVVTYGMLCPVFPDVLTSGRLDQLIDSIRPKQCETVWAEPFNDRANWRTVRDGYPVGSEGYQWLSRVFEAREPGAWSAYAADLYTHLHRRAVREEWIHKLVYMLYERGIVAADAPAFAGLQGVSLQSPTGADGRSRNPHIAAVTDHEPPRLSRFDLMTSDDDTAAPAVVEPTIRKAATACSGRSGLASCTDRGHACNQGGSDGMNRSR